MDNLVSYTQLYFFPLFSLYVISPNGVSGEKYGSERGGIGSKEETDEIKLAG